MSAINPRMKYLRKAVHEIKANVIFPSPFIPFFLLQSSRA
jgi:hypothetical protein